MAGRVNRSGLQVAEVLDTFINDEALPGSGVARDDFWSGVASLVSDLTQRNRTLLERRDELQSQIDRWHLDRKGQPIDTGAYKAFLVEIGYLVDEGPDFEIATAGVDPEIATIAGPQLVVPVLNARFALNAANARWGSLYDAFYGTDIIPEGVGTEKGTSYNPQRGDLVVARVAEELDKIVPLDSGSHADATSYSVSQIGGRYELGVQTTAGTTGLGNPDQFVGFQGNADGEPDCVLLRHNGLHIEIHIDRNHNVGEVHAAGVKDVVLESAITTIQDCEDSVSAVDAEDKTDVYRNWLGLMNASLAESFEKGGETIHRVLESDREYTDCEGGGLTLAGRSLMLVRNVGHLMTTDAVLLENGDEIFEGILDAVVTSLCAVHDIRRSEGQIRNAKFGSIYIVKPKMHGPEETAFTCELFDRVEDVLGLKRNTLKVGVMDEERRTSLNLRECVRVARERIVFINTGFLDGLFDSFAQQSG
ncbi:MAG TPA: malate synthase G [Gammaproteobacteria bacterium]|nr:malate synthase G [Gammaproteobacteria bacterium]